MSPPGAMTIAPAPPSGIIGRIEAKQTDGKAKTRASSKGIFMAILDMKNG
jgi:hypothetical protein